MIQIYTDGASRGNPGLSACGFCIFNNNKYIDNRVAVFKNSTNNRMELMAILLALKYCIDKNLQKSMINIYSDSQLSLGVCFNGWNANKNLDLVNKIKSLLTQFIGINSFKVKGHSNNQGNILIDKLLNVSMDNPNKLYIDKVYENSYN